MVGKDQELANTIEDGKGKEFLFYFSNMVLSFFL